MLKQRVKAFYVVIAAAIVGYFVYTTSAPTSKYAFKLGLDLSGGAHLVYKADISKIGTSTDITASMTALRDSVERRINAFGVSEPLVQTQENATLSSSEAPYKLIVELPGVTDTKQAEAAIGATPNLEFRIASSTMLADFQKKIAAAGTTTAQDTLDYLALFSVTGLDGSKVARAMYGNDPNTRQPIVDLSFTDDGRELFAKVTRENVGYILGIFLDGVPIETPVIREAIPNGTAQISGGFSPEQATTLVRNINFGALPIPITLISEQTIGPTLGQEAVQGGILAGIVSFLIIGLFLIIWYRLPGLIATVALAIYVILSLVIFKIGISPGILLTMIILMILAMRYHWGFGLAGVLFYALMAVTPGALSPITLTSAGIAGFILSIGMAVDANILIFERMKEELKRGLSINDAMHEGFSRAWTSIRDSNVSSFITGFILYSFGSSSVITGFAIVFVVGVMVSMASAISITRTLLYAIAPRTDSKVARFLISNGFKN